ncbi:MAG: hypothetical protein Q9169_005753 [Polycauliona sp. 2 TL-2023]
MRQIDRRLAALEKSSMDECVGDLSVDFVRKARQEQERKEDSGPHAGNASTDDGNVGAVDCVTRGFLEENNLNWNYFDMVRKHVKYLERHDTASYDSKFELAEMMLDDRWKQRPEPRYWQAMFQFTYEATYEEVAAAKPMDIIDYVNSLCKADEESQTRNE